MAARPANGRPRASAAWSGFAEPTGSRMQVRGAHERRRGTGDRACVAKAIAAGRGEEGTRWSLATAEHGSGGTAVRQAAEEAEVLVPAACQGHEGAVVFRGDVCGHGDLPLVAARFGGAATASRLTPRFAAPGPASASGRGSAGLGMEEIGGKVPAKSPSGAGNEWRRSIERACPKWPRRREGSIGLGQRYAGGGRPVSCVAYRRRCPSQGTVEWVPRRPGVRGRNSDRLGKILVALLHTRSWTRSWTGKSVEGRLPTPGFWR